MNILLAFAVLAAALPALSVQARPPGEVAQVAIRHGDLDLARGPDIARLDRRIRIAVETACGEPTDYDPTGTNAIRRCRAEARAALLPRRAQLIAFATRRNVLAAR